MEKGPVLIDGRIDALEIHVLRLGSRVLEAEPLEGTNLGHVAQEYCEHLGSESRFSVVLAPFFLVVGPRKTVQELLLREVGLLAHHVFLMGLQRDLGHLRDQPADGETIGTDGEVFMSKHTFYLQAVDDREDSLQQRL